MKNHAGGPLGEDAVSVDNQLGAGMDEAYQLATVATMYRFAAMATTLPDDFRALTFTQPYGWAVIYGGKNIDNRKVPAPQALIGQPIAIHVSVACDPKREREIAAQIFARTGMRVPVSNDVTHGTVDSSGMTGIELLAHSATLAAHAPPNAFDDLGRVSLRDAYNLNYGKIIGLMTIDHIVDMRAELAEASLKMSRLHPWWLGPVGLFLRNIIPLDPIACPEGFHRGYWRVCARVRLEIEKQLAARAERAKPAATLEHENR